MPKTVEALWKIELLYGKHPSYTESTYAVKLTTKEHHYYKYHDYTGFIETASTIQTCQPFGCGPVNEY